MPVNLFDRLSNETKWNIIRQAEPEDRRALRHVNKDFRANVDAHLTVRRVKTHRILADVLKSSYSGNIDSLDLSESGLNDTHLRNAIGSHNQFKVLFLKNNNIGDQSMTSLSQIKSLEKMDLSGTFVTADGLNVLAELPALHSLVLAGNQSMGELGAILPRFPALKELDLSNAEFSEASMSGAAGIPALKKLSLNNNKQFSHAVAVSLSSHQGLEELNISDVELDSASLRALADIRNLKSIDLSFNRHIKDEDIHYLCNKNRNLEQIHLNSTNISDSGIEAIAGLQNLKKLSFCINEGGLSDETIIALTNLSTLKNLSIEYLAPLSSEKLKKIAAIPGLNSLEFSGDQNTIYDEADLAPLAKNSSLEKLLISNAKMTEDGVRILANIPALKVLSFSTGNQVSINNQTFTRLINHPTLQELILNDIDLSVNHIVESPQNSQLESLTFQSQTPDDNRLINMFTGLKKLKNITIQSLNVNDQALIQMIDRMPALEVVELFGTQVGDIAMAALARLSGLKRLSISTTRVTNKGITALAGSTSLEELEMDNTETDCNCLPVLLGMKSLRKVDISDTNILLDEEDVDDFLASPIHSVALEISQINQKGLTALQSTGLRVERWEYDTDDDEL